MESAPIAVKFLGLVLKHFGTASVLRGLSLSPSNEAGVITGICPAAHFLDQPRLSPVRAPHPIASRSEWNRIYLYCYCFTTTKHSLPALNMILKILMVKNIKLPGRVLSVGFAAV